MTLDLGAEVDGYCSDCTRTWATGEIDDDLAAIYDLVLRAQETALGAVRAGPTGREVDAVARDLITAEGHGEHFGHGLGHGVGLQVHEGPRLARTASDPLVAGNVVTVEPGVYVPGARRRADRGSRGRHRRRLRRAERHLEGAGHRRLTPLKRPRLPADRGQDDFPRPHSPLIAPGRLRGRPRRPHGSRDCGCRRPRRSFCEEEEGQAPRRHSRHARCRSRSARRSRSAASYFLRGRNKNSVVFKRDGGKAVFVKAGVGTTKLLRVKLPAKLEKEFTKRGTSLVPTRFRVRVLAKKFGKRFTKASRSPVISLRSAAAARLVESLPDGDCDGDGAKNGRPDDDNDGLTEGIEESLNLNPCTATPTRTASRTVEFDCDHNGMLNRARPTTTRTCSDGHEGDRHRPLQRRHGRRRRRGRLRVPSARDLNDDEYQQPERVLPYPGKRPYPNPLFSGRGHRLRRRLADARRGVRALEVVPSRHPRSTRWTTRTASSTRSAATERPPSRRRPPRADASRYVPSSRVRRLGRAPPATRRRAPGRPAVVRRHASRNLYGDFRPSTRDRQRVDRRRSSELYYNDLDGDGYLSDDERDEDADGLTNYDESHGRMLATYWTGCYSGEKPYHVAYAGTNIADADTDGDGVRDGADDQDHDDIPNLAELSRNAAPGSTPIDRGCDKEALGGSHHPSVGRVNPFNPCLPDTNARGPAPGIPRHRRRGGSVRRLAELATS